MPRPFKHLKTRIAYVVIPLKQNSHFCREKHSTQNKFFYFFPRVWLAKWCKNHKVYIHSHSMLLLVFTNIFIHNQQPNLHSRNIFIHIYLCISYSRLYLLTFTRCLHSNSTSYSHYSFSIFCAPPLRIGQYKISTADYGLRTTDYGLRTTDWV